MDDDLQHLWADDPEPTPEVDLDAIRRRAARFRRQIAVRNLVEVFAAGIVVAGFSALAWLADDPLRLWGHAAVAVGGLVIAGIVIARGEAPAAAPAASTAEFLAAERDALRYQARLLRWVPLWYLGPLIPGSILLTIAAWVDEPARGMLLLFVFSAVFAFVAVLNRAKGRELADRADVLDQIADEAESPPAR